MDGNHLTKCSALHKCYQSYTGKEIIQDPGHSGYCYYDCENGETDHPVEKLCIIKKWLSCISRTSSNFPTLSIVPECCAWDVVASYQGLGVSTESIKIYCTTSHLFNNIIKSVGPSNLAFCRLYCFLSLCADSTFPI